MSTIKSSDEHLTINADGSGKDIKFQANGVEKASISSSGAFTSTTIDATKLTGDLPAISGANLTGVGVAGITSTADATAITIDSSENVGIGVVPESNWISDETALQVGGIASLSATTAAGGGNWTSWGNNFYKQAAGGSGRKYIETGYASNVYMGDGAFYIDVAASGSADAAITWTNALTITNDGRGLSQFTAKAWINFDGTGTIAIRDSHNISSITDNSTGSYTVNMSNALANDDYSAQATSGGNEGRTDNINVNSSSQFLIRCNAHDGNAADQSFVMATVFGD